MKHVVIGTAGHIDHGKTSMIKALTGFNTDTLKEEQERGITVNLGFTYLKLNDDFKVGIIDVPGHEKLIKNMLAGVCGMDLILLTVAADDGIMPQTLEHMEIIKFLKVENVIVVLTKTDLVSAERIEAVKADVKKTFQLEHFVPFSVYQEETIESLRQVIIQNIRLKDQTTEDAFRMPIDRVFNMKGQGVVVTGSALSGHVSVGDTLEVLPTKKAVRVKGIQAFNETRTQAHKHMRVALNLAGIKRQELQRGFVIATQETVFKSHIIDVKLTVSKHLTEPIRHLERVKFYYLSSEIYCRVKLLNRRDISEGETVYGQLLLDDGIYASKKDLGVLRRINPSSTIAGVEIINVFGAFVHRKDDTYATVLNLHEQEDKPQLIEQYLKNEPFAKVSELKQKLDLTDEDVNTFMLEQGVVFHDQSCLTHSLFALYENKLTHVLETFHQENPHDIGMNKQLCQQALNIRISNKTFNAFIKQTRKITSHEDKVKLSAFKLQYNEVDQNVILQIIKTLEADEFSPKKPHEIITIINAPRTEKLFYALLNEGKLVKIESDIVLTEHTFQTMRNKLDTFFSQHTILHIKDARDLLKTSRKYVVAYLEYLDKIGYTRRVENGRVKKI